MTDYTISVGFRSDNIGRLTQDVERGATAVDHVGRSADRSSVGVAKLDRAFEQLSVASQRVAVAQQRAAEAERHLTRVREAGAAGTRQETVALDRYLAAQERVIGMTHRMERAQLAANAAAAASMRAGGGAVSGAAGGFLTRGMGSMTGLAGFATGAFAINSVSQVQRAELSLTALLGSRQKSDAMIRELQSYASKTPFNFTNLLATTQQFLAMGTAADMVLPRIRVIADTVGAMGGSNEQIRDIALAISQINNSSHANAQDLRQLVESGHIDPFKYIAEGMHLDRKTVADRVNRGELNLAGEDAARFILEGMEREFKGGAQRASATLSGQISNLVDTAQIAAAKTLKPLLPELTGTVKVAGGTLGFVSNHESLRTTIELLAVARLGARGFQAAQERGWFLTAVAAKRGSTAVVEANAAVAASYRAVGAAAGTAAAQVAALDVAEAAGGATRLAGGARGVSRFGRFAGGVSNLAGGPLGLGIAAAGIWGMNAKTVYDDFHEQHKALADAKAAHEATMLALDETARRRAIRDAALTYRPAGAAQMAGTAGAARADAAASLRLRAARAYMDSRSYVKDAANVPLPGLFDALPEVDPSKVADAREAKRIADARVRTLELRARGAGGGPSTSALLGAEARVRAARVALGKVGGDPTVESLRLQAAEAHLVEVRGSGHRSAATMTAAENTLAAARLAARRAGERLSAAEKEASGDRSLSAAEVVKRATHNAATSQNVAANARKLVKAGVTQPVLQALLQMEQTAPGTMANVAKQATAAYVKQLNDDYAAIGKAGLDIARLGGDANYFAALAESYRTGRTLGELQRAGFLAGLTDEPGAQLGGGGSPSARQLFSDTPKPTLGGGPRSTIHLGVSSDGRLVVRGGPAQGSPAPKLPPNVKLTPLIPSPPPIVAPEPLPVGTPGFRPAYLTRLHPADLAALQSASGRTLTVTASGDSRLSIDIADEAVRQANLGLW